MDKIFQHSPRQKENSSLAAVVLRRLVNVHYYRKFIYYQRKCRHNEKGFAH